MHTQLLTTKLYIPPARPNLVPRPRLLERLDEGLRLSRKLTLVSAPAGLGKTTLLSDWSMAAASAAPAPIRRCPSPGCVPEGSSASCGPTTCASQPRRSPRS